MNLHTSCTCVHLYAGAKPGYYFSSGPAGLGYYQDVPEASTIPSGRPALHTFAPGAPGAGHHAENGAVGASAQPPGNGAAGVGVALGARGGGEGGAWCAATTGMGAGQCGCA